MGAGQGRRGDRYAGVAQRGSFRQTSVRVVEALANELSAADEAELKARRTLHNRVLRALPAKKAVRYLQLESKIRAVQAYDVAAASPLVK